MEMFDYNGDNVKQACQTIKNSLSSDLLPKKWIERNKTNPMFGHCHTASACLQKLFGSQNIKLYRALDDEDIWHWWAVTKEGELIDITADQYLYLVSQGTGDAAYTAGRFMIEIIGYDVAF